MNIACYILPVLLGFAPPHGRPDFVGTWALDTSDDARAILRQAGLPEQEVRVRLFSDQTFEYRTRLDGRSQTTRGHFDVDGDRITLDADEEFPDLRTAEIDGRLTEDGLDLDGAAYHRVREPIRRDERPMPRLQPPVLDPPVVETPVTPRPPRPQFIDLAGSWDLVRNGLEDRSVKFRFTKSGHFEFLSSNASSSGRYTVADGELTLNYDEVDGAPVSFPMRKQIDLDDQDSFTIDSFTYVKTR